MASASMASRLVTWREKALSVGVVTLSVTSNRWTGNNRDVHRCLRCSWVSIPYMMLLVYTPGEGARGAPGVLRCPRHVPGRGTGQ